MLRRDLSKTLFAAVAGSALSTRRAEAQTCNYPCYDVRQFGAVAGSSDSTSAIQNAIDSTPQYGVLEINENYSCRELILNNWLDRTIRGSGSLTLHSSAASGAVLLRATGAVSNLKIQGLRLIGRNTTSNDEVGIAFGPSSRVTNFLIEAVSFVWLNVGIYANGSTSGGLYGGGRIVGCYFEDIVGVNSGQGLGVLLENALSVVVASNVFRRTCRHAVYVSSGADVNHIIVGNVFERHRETVAALTRRAAVSIGRCSDVLVACNTFKECHDGAIEVFFDSGTGTNGTNGQGVLITGNKFLNRRNSVADVSIGDASIPIGHNCYDVSVKGNQFRSDQLNAGPEPFIYILNGQRLAVKDNEMTVMNAATPQYLVRLGDSNYITSDLDCTQSHIAGNTAWVTGTSASTCKFVVVTGDICTNSSGHCIEHNKLFGPGYVDFAATQTNASLFTDADQTWTATLTGCNGSPTGTVQGTIGADGVVTLYIPPIVGVASSTSTAATLTGMPVAFRPLTTQSDTCVTTDNSIDRVSRIVIGSDGVVRLYSGASAVFATAGTKGIQTSTVTYRMR